MTILMFELCFVFMHHGFTQLLQRIMVSTSFTSALWFHRAGQSAVALVLQKGSISHCAYVCLFCSVRVVLCGLFLVCFRIVCFFVLFVLFVLFGVEPEKAGLQSH